MRRSGQILVVFGLAGALLAAGSGPAAADEAVGGNYEVAFTSVANNCSSVGMNLGSSTIAVDSAKPRRISITIPSVPIMSGTVSRVGKFRASVKRGKTAIEGVQGRFSVAGKFEKGQIQFLFVAEYFRAEKPLCTQSWNATGPRKN